MVPVLAGCYLYGRSFNPTVRYLGRQLAALEGTEAGYATSSGMAAISSVLLHFCNSGDHIVASNAVYGEVLVAVCSTTGHGLFFCFECSWDSSLGLFFVIKAVTVEKTMPDGSGGTFALLKDFLPLKCNISTTFVPISDLSAVEKAIQSNTKVGTLPLTMKC